MGKRRARAWARDVGRARREQLAAAKRAWWLNGGRSLSSPVAMQALERVAVMDCVEAICGGALPHLSVPQANARAYQLRRLADVACSPPPAPQGRWGVVELQWGAAVRAQACLELASAVRCSARDWANTHGLDREWRRLVARAVQEKAPTTHTKE